MVTDNYSGNIMIHGGQYGTTFGNMFRKLFIMTF